MSQKTLTALADFLESQEMDLKPMQKLLGRLNDICLMCPFLKTFKGPMNDLLSKLQNSDGKNVNIPVQCKRDARVFAGFLLDQNPWVPIAHRPMGIPIRHMEFVSDAAGFTQSSTREELRGAGSIGFNCRLRFNGSINYFVCKTLSNLLSHCQMIETKFDNCVEPLHCVCRTKVL